MVTNIIYGAIMMAFGAILGSLATTDGIADQCQKKTFFNVSGKRFECMEWKRDYAPDRPTQRHLQPAMPPQ